MGEICCSPPLRVPPQLHMSLFKDRKKVQRFFQIELQLLIVLLIFET